MKVDTRLKGELKELQNESAIKAEFIPLSEKQFIVKCKIIENNVTIFEVQTLASSREQAVKIVKNWEENTNEIYPKVKDIANIDEDFATWYTDIVRKADLADYTDTKGCIAIKSYGFAIWENIRNYADKLFKETGVQNVYFPMLIPESLLQKEKDHVEGFAPEVALVTEAGGEKLEENLVIRPTSETIFSNLYSKWLKSWRDLPMVYNQWCSVLRWEKETRPFLRSREFL